MSRLGVCFATTNTEVGKSIYKQCAEYLLPCVMELGGKNPVVITKNISRDNLKNAAWKLVD